MIPSSSMISHQHSSIQSSSFSQCKLYLILIGLFDVSHTILRSSPRKWLLNLKGGILRNKMFGTQQVMTTQVALAQGSTIGISCQSKCFLHMNPATLVDTLYFSLLTTNETVTQPQGYTIAGSSVIHLPNHNPDTPSSPMVQYANPEPVVIDNLQPVVPATAMLLFDILTITHPNVQGNLNVRHSLIFSNEEWLAIFPANNAVSPVKSFYFNQAPPSNSSGYHLPASSSFTTSDFHYPPHSTCQPTTSSSWQSLANIQLCLYQRCWLPHSEYQSWTWKWCFNSRPNSWTLPETVQESSSTALWQRYSLENSDSGHSS